MTFKPFKFNPVYSLRQAGSILLAVLFAACVNAQLISFPGAEGAGRFTSGGRGTAAVPTTVFEVTNLNDDNNPGSLRYALTQNVPYRTVVFRVAGTIRLTSSLNIRSNTTIAGQTAPGDGICIADKPLVINGDNIIIRYLRIRLGDRLQAAVLGNDDALSGTGKKNIIIDHCSMSWSNDEAFTVYDGDSTTLQWNIISEPLNNSYHDEGSGIQPHAYGGIWGGRYVTAHHNLIVHCLGRTPRFAGSRTLPPFTAGQENMDFRNNIIYNWGSYSANGGEGGNYNLVNNYYKYGPSTATGNASGVPVKGMLLQPSQQTTAPVLPYGKFYLQGNFVDGYPGITSNNWTGVAMNGGTQADTGLAKATTAFAAEPVTTQSATAAYELVLQYAGASWRRDTLDTRLANNVRNRTGRIIDVQGGYPAGTPFTISQAAWPQLQGGAAPADTDHDGMPDAWEIANGLNPANPDDRGLTATNGYTNLENYLNSIVAEPFIAVSAAQLNPWNQNTGAAAITQAYTVSATSLTGTLLITPPAGFQVSGDGGTTWNDNANPMSLNAAGGEVTPANISVRINTGTAGNYSGNILHTSAGAQAVTVAVTGTVQATTVPPGTSAVVAKDGSGNFTTVQAAINAAPAGLTAPYIIFIKNGTYIEKVIIPASKPFIQLIGESAAGTVISWADGATTPLPGGGVVGTFNSYTLYVAANDCALMNLTILNSFGESSQAVALRADGDRLIVRGCRIMGNQDTMLNNANAGLKQYFRNCYIDGNIDFLFGSARVILDSCVIYAKDRTTGTGNSFITAANTQAGQAYGYVFRNCILPPNRGGTSYFLGRPWQNSTGASPVANNKVVFLNSTMSSSILPAGWSIWDAGTNTSLIYFGEYKSKKFDGTPVNTGSRVSWSFQLTDAEAGAYTDASLFGTWNPCAAGSGFCAAQPAEIAFANFIGKKTAAASVFEWNACWATPQVTYELYRAATRTGAYTKVAETISQEDTTYNFQLTDVLPAAGTSFFYYLAASKPGFITTRSDTVEISSIPTITVLAPPAAFTQVLGAPSASQSITVSGANLTGNIIITPPPAYEISANAGAAWVGSSSSITLSPVNNAVPNTALLVRLNAAALGTYNGNLNMLSAGAATVNLPLTGNTIAAPTSIVLQAWPLTSNSSDSAAARSAGVTASTPTFRNLFTSDGTTPSPPIPAYSGQYGQAFGANAAGNNWSAVGGNLNRSYYQQFTITAAPGFNVKVDSLTFLCDFYLTTSGIKMDLVYSVNNFVTDSFEYSGGTGPTGASIPFVPNGSFSRAFTLTRNDNGAVNYYSLALNGSTGVTINPGQTLTIRLYWACSSTGTPRFAFLKNVRVKGSALNTLPLNLLSFTGSRTGSQVQLQWTTVQEQGISRYAVQRSNNGLQFTTIGHVTATGGNAGSRYIFADVTPLPVAYYRLQVEQANGRTAYSPVLVLRNVARPVVTVFPNPANEYLSVNHPAAGTAGYVRIYAANGKELLRKQTIAGALQTNLDMAVIPPGVYWLIFENEGARQAVQFMKQ